MPVHSSSALHSCFPPCLSETCNGFTCTFSSFRPQLSRFCYLKCFIFSSAHISGWHGYCYLQHNLAEMSPAPTRETAFPYSWLSFLHVISSPTSSTFPPNLWRSHSTAQTLPLAQNLPLLCTRSLPSVISASKRHWQDDQETYTHDQNDERRRHIRCSHGSVGNSAHRLQKLTIPLQVENQAQHTLVQLTPAIHRETI